GWPGLGAPVGHEYHGRGRGRRTRIQAWRELHRHRPVVAVVQAANACPPPPLLGLWLSAAVSPIIRAGHTRPDSADGETMPDDITIYHNPACGTSRKVLAALR